MLSMARADVASALRNALSMGRYMDSSVAVDDQALYQGRAALHRVPLCPHRLGMPSRAREQDAIVRTLEHAI